MAIQHAFGAVYGGQVAPTKEGCAGGGQIASPVGRSGDARRAKALDPVQGITSSGRVQPAKNCNKGRPRSSATGALHSPHPDGSLLHPVVRADDKPMPPSMLAQPKDHRLGAFQWQTGQTSTAQQRHMEISWAAHRRSGTRTSRFLLDRSREIAGRLPRGSGISGPASENATRCAVCGGRLTQ